MTTAKFQASIKGVNFDDESASVIKLEVPCLEFLQAVKVAAMTKKVIDVQIICKDLGNDASNGQLKLDEKE